MPTLDLSRDDSAAGGFGDTAGKVGAFLAEHDVTVCIVRPDYYVYGACAEVRELGDMVDRLGKQLSLRTS